MVRILHFGTLISHILKGSRVCHFYEFDRETHIVNVVAILCVCFLPEGEGINLVHLFLPYLRYFSSKSWKDIPLWVFLLSLVWSHPNPTEATDRKRQWQPNLDRSSLAKLHWDPTGALLRGILRAVCLFHLGGTLSWEGQSHVLRAVHKRPTLEVSMHRVASHSHKLSAHVMLGDKAAGVLSGGLLLEWWLPSNKIMLLS